MKRTFIAVKIIITNQTENFIRGIEKALDKESVKWVDTQNMHITLRFLGYTQENVIDEIGNRLSEHLNQFGTFKLICKGFGVFKNLHSPRVLWLGIEKSDELTKLKEEIDCVLLDFGYEKEERAFQPHLTLGRVKNIKDKETLKRLLSQYKNTYIQKFVIDKVIFYESILTRKGPVYKMLRECRLN